MLKNLRQKKILIVILSILLLVSVFTLTGCGPQIGGIPTGGNEAQNGGENQQAQGTQNNNVQQGITTILTVVYGFDDGRTLVTGVQTCALPISVLHCLPLVYHQFEVHTQLV